MPADKLSIAFGNFCNSGWIAGCHYLRNLLFALKSLQEPPEIAVYGVGPTDTTYQMLLPYVDKELHLSHARPYSKFVKYLIQRQAKIKLHVDSPNTHMFRSQGINALFTFGEDFGDGFSLPLLIWQPDFQFIHLPAMFSDKEIEQRRQGLDRAAAYADRVVLSSQDALRDYEQTLPALAHKGRVLSFVAQIPTSIYDKDPGWVCAEYHLPERFIYLPNQFWKHKNHKNVIEALAIAIMQRPDLNVVCTGNTYDYRSPAYFPQEILPLIASRGVRDRLIVLGTVPHDHVFALIRQSLAVLQPSLFEGWSTTVEETKSVGKQMILSSISVHREQAPGQSRFFDPHEPNDIAAGLIQIWDEAKAGPDFELEAQSRQQLPVRTRAFGQAFVAIVNDVRIPMRK